MVTVTEPKPPAAGGAAEAGVAGAEPLGLGGVAAGGSMVTDTDGAAVAPTGLASAGVVTGAEGGVSAGADAGASAGMAAPHLMQNLVGCCASNPQATHLREAMMNFLEKLYLSSYHHSR